MDPDLLQWIRSYSALRDSVQLVQAHQVLNENYCESSFVEHNLRQAGLVGDELKNARQKHSQATQPPRKSELKIKCRAVDIVGYSITNEFAQLKFIELFRGESNMGRGQNEECIVSSNPR